MKVTLIFLTCIWVGSHQHTWSITGKCFRGWLRHSTFTFPLWALKIFTKSLLPSTGCCRIAWRRITSPQMTTLSLLYSSRHRPFAPCIMQTNSTPAVIFSVWSWYLWKVDYLFPVSFRQWNDFWIESVHPAHHSHPDTEAQ